MCYNHYARYVVRTLGIALRGAGFLDAIFGYTSVGGLCFQILLGVCIVIPTCWAHSTGTVLCVGMGKYRIFDHGCRVGDATLTRVPLHASGMS